MAKQKKQEIALSEYLERSVSEGRHYFTMLELEEANLTLKADSISASLSRLARKGRLRMVRRGFGILLAPHEGELHPSYYLDAMMHFLGAEYYVGLLSAAAHWGASHQASMSYQVITNKIISKISYDRGRVEFVTKKDTFPGKGMQKVAGVGGYYVISSPELTAIDLVRFPKVSGHLSNVATVLEDLVEKWDGRKMISLCHDSKVPTVTLQRLGYILDSVLGLNKEAEYIQRPLAKRRPVPSLLSASKKITGLKRSELEYSQKWMIYVNSEVEPD